MSVLAPKLTDAKLLPLACGDVYLGVSSEAGLQEVGQFGVPERDVERVALQGVEHLRDRKLTVRTPHRRGGDH